MILLHDLSFEQTVELMQSFNQPAYRAGQLYDGINAFTDIDQIYQLPKPLRERISADFVTKPLEVANYLQSKDGSIKYLFRLYDNQLIESIYMPHNYGNTVCVSTQVGCKMGCVFCASGANGIARNLSRGEILSQVLLINKLHMKDGKRAVDNVVLMGSGEPLDNYGQVLGFIELVTNARGINIGMRSLSLSTCGLPDKIKQLADDGFSGTLSVSLHASNDQTRQKLMKIAQIYTIDEVLAAAKYFFNKSKRRVIIEYALIKGINDTFSDAEKLAALLKGFSSHVNLIPLNPVGNKNLSPTPKHAAYAFLEHLKKLNVSATLRKSMGVDINGACGQLRNLYVGQNTPVSSAKKP